MTKWLALIVGVGSVLASLHYVVPEVTSFEYTAPGSDVALLVQTHDEQALPTAAPDTRPVVRHVPLPPQVKAIYMSSCVAGTPDFRSSLVRLINETELNAVVLDIKDYSGTISFNPGPGAWLPAWQAAECGARDMRDFISILHDNHIFVIGRITVFQDPFYTKARPELAVKRADGETVWKDHKGLSFIDVGAPEYWDHVIELSKLSYNIGFDELNFDYVRYPSDGNMADTAYTHSGTSTKPENLETFFAYLHAALEDAALYSEYRHTNTGRATATPWTSADLFGMTTTNTDDLSIGQVQERAVPYFNFIAPMVYPSHYPGSFLGLGNPNLYPYKVVHYAMRAGVERLVSSTTPVAAFTHERIGTTTPAIYRKSIQTADVFRTWIQDFDYGGDYDAADVRAQIQASYDAGVMSWMIWAPSNRYTREALLGPGVYEVSTSTESGGSLDR